MWGSPTLANINQGPEQLVSKSPGRTHALLSALSSRRKSCSMTHVDRHHPFLWSGCFISIISYALLLSDVLRTGPALRRIPTDMYPLEPDSAASMGPVGYAVIRLTLENATTQATTPFWAYKYDTTSVGMRGLAQHRQVASWSPCLLYQDHCNETQGLPLLTVFTMIDSLVGAMQDNHTHQQSTTLRINSLFRDALHHYVILWFFEYTVKRTIQGTHHDWYGIDLSNSIVCNSMDTRYTYSCSQVWANRLKKACTQSQRECRQMRTMREQISRRVQLLSRVYPNTTIDSVIVDSTDDYAHGGIAFPGRRRADVVVLSRMRSCVKETCTTIAVDDYRIETSMHMMVVAEWFGIVAVLRLLAQAYTWLRVVLLVWVCHMARRDASRQYRQSSRLTQCRTVLRTIFLVPSQVVVYGSLVPISLYYLAHLIDSPATYAVASVKFNSLLGAITWKFVDIAHYCAVSMRGVWVLSFYCHLIQAAVTNCMWSASFGVPGVSEFVITSIASLTLLAQDRMLMLRNTAVFEVFEVVPSARVHRLRSYPQTRTQTTVFNLLFGQTIDLKCLTQAAIMLALLCGILKCFHRMVPRYFPFEVSMSSQTLVPYSGGYLWPRNRLVVSWFGSLVRRASHRSAIQSTHKQAPAQTCEAPMVAVAGGSYQHSLRDRTFLRRISTRTSLQVQQELHSATNRGQEIESVIYLMNIAVMTDPLTFLRLRFFSGHQVAIYESKSTHQCFLLPYELKVSDGDVGINWERLQLVGVVNTKDLQWDDLLRCG